MATLARWQRSIVDSAGAVLPNAAVEVRRESDNGLATLFTERTGTTGLSNPFNADSAGYASFHVIGGAYKITATSGAQSITWRYVGIGTSSETDISTSSFSTSANTTVTGLWNFSGGTATAPPVQLNGGGPGLYWNSTDSRNYYTGTIASGTGTTLVLSANPTNYWTGNPCCKNDMTIVNACVSLNRGGTIQIAKIAPASSNGYTASSRTVSIVGNVYNKTTNALIGATFNPLPVAGDSFTIGDSEEYGYYRWIADRNLFIIETWQKNLSQADPYPFFTQDEYIRINRLNATLSTNYGLSGNGAQNFYLATNTIFNADISFPNGQPARNMSFYTLLNSGDSGNTGDFPSSYPITYALHESMRLAPQTYSGGVPVNAPHLWTATNVRLGVGTASYPDALFEVRNNTAQVAGTLFAGTVAHIVGPDGSANPTRLVLDTFNTAGGSITMRTAGGTAASPGATASGAMIAAYSGVGYQTTASADWTGAKARIGHWAAETFTNTAQGAYTTFETTKVGTTTLTERLRITSEGALTLAAVGTFSALPASPVAGMIAHITDSNTNVWGATAAGGGANRVLLFYNGANWTVFAK